MGRRERGREGGRMSVLFEASCQTVSHDDLSSSPV